MENGKDYLQRTLVLLKPDAVQRGVCGEIIHRFERAGLNIVGLKMLNVSEELARKHYSAHIGKSFYKGLEKFITESPLIAIVLEGVEVITTVRKLVGSTDPSQAMPGTIRGDFAHHTNESRDAKGLATANLIHASGNEKEAKQEIALWFSENELMNYSKIDDKYTF